MNEALGVIATSMVPKRKTRFRRKWFQTRLLVGDHSMMWFEVTTNPTTHGFRSRLIKVISSVLYAPKGLGLSGQWIGFMLRPRVHKYRMNTLDFRISPTERASEESRVPVHNGDQDFPLHPPVHSHVASVGFQGRAIFPHLLPVSVNFHHRLRVPGTRIDVEISLESPAKGLEREAEAGLERRGKERRDSKAGMLERVGDVSGDFPAASFHSAEVFHFLVVHRILVNVTFEKRKEES